MTMASLTFGMQWSGIFLSWSSELEGIKSKIEKSFVVKEHFEVSQSASCKDLKIEVKRVPKRLVEWCTVGPECV